jgi:energy-coupling factor transporter ATP-binding protein EcfA2
MSAALDSILTTVGPLVPIAAVVLAAALLAVIGIRVVPRLRERGYDRVAARERVRLVVALPARDDPDASVPAELIRALHPRQRRGLDWWRVGWPTYELRVTWRAGELAWEIETDGHGAAIATAALRALYPGVAIERSSDRDSAPAAVATGRLTGPIGWPFREVGAPEARPVRALAAALEHAPAGTEVRLRCLARPVPPERWRRDGATTDDDASPSVIGFLLRTVVDAIFLRPVTDPAPRRQAARLTAAERDAEARRRKGVVGFDVTLSLEVAGIAAPAAEALLWRLIGFTAALDDGTQAIRWQIRRGGSARGAAGRFADWELAQLWSLPDAAFDRAGFARARPLGAAPPVIPIGLSLVLGTSRGRDLALPADALARHLAVFGSTGSGKSTLLLNLVGALATSPIGVTVIDPHGDLTGDILARLPATAATRVHVLRLADREHPRGFNFLERRTPDEAQLVTSEFVELFEDLWPRFCGPKMQHYLRHALLTLLSGPEPGTIIELTRILTDDAFRQPLVDKLTDPLVAAFWRTEWPGPKERERDSSIKAVLNKLGAFVTYASIRSVVGQGVSTIHPRTLMDAGDILLVDLSGVGGDNANLFGAMLISRYLIDATGRQGTPRDQRRQHVLVVDEAQRFDTRAMGKIAVEGRKFGLALAIASQSLGGLGERLRETVLTNAACLALLSPGADDARGLGRLVAPIPVEELAAMCRFEVLLRMPGPDGRPGVYGGTVNPPGPADDASAAAMIARSDARDARPLDDVAAEVARRSGPIRKVEAAAAADPLLASSDLR